MGQLFFYLPVPLPLLSPTNEKTILHHFSYCVHSTFLLAASPCPSIHSGDSCSDTIPYHASVCLYNAFFSLWTALLCGLVHAVMLRFAICGNIAACPCAVVVDRSAVAGLPYRLSPVPIVLDAVFPPVAEL